MLESLSIRTFKSLEDMTVDLGMVNVFIGAKEQLARSLGNSLGRIRRESQ
jgi:predicted ATPase